MTVGELTICYTNPDCMLMSVAYGNSRRTIRLDLVQSMRPQVLEMGLATATELDDLDAAARAHLDNPHTVVMSGLLFLTWGRKPDRAQQDFPPTS